MKVLPLLSVCAVGAFLLAGAVVHCTAQQANASVSALVPVSAPALVNCSPVSLQPCLSVGLMPVTASGAPAPVTLPAPQELAHSFTLTGAAGSEEPFFASAGAGTDAGQHTSVVLLEIDISGSMNQPVAGGMSRFEAARQAIRRFLEGMEEGSDEVAIVPFESHNVVSTIRSAVFTSHRGEALAQLQALPTPQGKNNTALYQAVFSGEQTLQDELASLRRAGVGGGDLQPHLIVMTDGRNEVKSGDDPDLLNGELGLQQAAAKVQAAHVDTLGIGFGDRAAIDTAAMQKLSTRFFYAADSQQLLDALHVARSAVSHTLTVTWLLPEESRLALAGRDIQVLPTMKLPDGRVLSGPAVRYTVPATSAPNYDRAARPEELRALFATHPVTSNGWTEVLLHLLLYLGAGALLVLLWFWLPRLIWGDRITGPVSRPQRWSSGRPGVMAASGTQVRSAHAVPEGFTAAQGAGPLQRSAAQTTQIQPRSELSRTRLSFEQK